MKGTVLPVEQLHVNVNKCGTCKNNKEQKNLLLLSFFNFNFRCHPVVSTRNFYWDGTGWCENSTRWKTCKQVRALGRGAWACLAHALQCLCDGRVLHAQLHD